LAAIEQRQSWVMELGPPPADQDRREQWLSQLDIVAAAKSDGSSVGACPSGKRRPCPASMRLICSAPRGPWSTRCRSQGRSRSQRQSPPIARSPSRQPRQIERLVTRTS